MGNKINKFGKQTSAANSFGSGQDIIGMEYRGKTIVDASRKYITLTDGSTYSRKGAYIQHEPIIVASTIYDTETEGDRL